MRFAVSIPNTAGALRLPKNGAIHNFAPVDSQLAQYAPVLLLALVAIAFAGATIAASVLVGRWANRHRLRRGLATKNTPYECGMLPVGEGGARLSVKFYLVAMLFILFDIEVVFLFPWAVVYRDLLAVDPNLIFGSMLSFLGILFVGYLYALKKGAFDWKS
jgi:NADH-quinone oxidoreductase subunit A